MHDQATTAAQPDPTGPPEAGNRAAWRNVGRDIVLANALRKRAAGVPTYSIPEAAALLSVSQEHLSRLVRADAVPALRMRLGADQGRYVVPAAAVERLLDAVVAGGGCAEIAELTDAWREGLPTGGGR